MFTGIIQFVGTIKAAKPSGSGRSLAIDLGPLADGLAVGDSVAVDGVCLTASSLTPGGAAFDVIAETLSRTTLGARAPGEAVNLERAVRPSGFLDGHIVQGHIDGVARLATIDHAAGQYVLKFSCEKGLTDEMVAKGSVAIDGISLTLVQVADGGFSVAIIPTTLDKTTLGRRCAGDKVNIETDILGKYVRRMLGQAGLTAGHSSLTIEKLRQAGFE